MYLLKEENAHILKMTNAIQEEFVALYPEKEKNLARLNILAGKLMEINSTLFNRYTQGKSDVLDAIYILRNSAK